MESYVLRALEASMMAGLGMTSLIIGVLAGIFLKPSARVNAIIMAFGTGALIQALSLELAFEGGERLIHEAHYTGWQAWLLVSTGFAAGGILYFLGNRQLDKYGAAIRHPALTERFLMQKKRLKSDQLLSRLARVDLLRSLPPEEMEDVLLCVEPKNFAANAVIFEKGDEPHGLFLLEAGEVLVLSGQAGDERKDVLAKLGPGASFGETALLTGEKRTATVVAATPVSTLEIDREHFLELLDRSPRLRNAVETLNTERILKNVSERKTDQDAAEWKERAMSNVHRISRREHDALMAEHGSSAPLALFMGAALDGIPESIVVGASFVSLATFEYTFLAAIFISNIPEAIASTLAMVKAGFSFRKILGLWSFLVFISALAAGLANIFLSGAHPAMLTAAGSVAGGGILAMVASVMMPEAYENGGPAVGLATIAGFLTALMFLYI